MAGRVDAQQMEIGQSPDIGSPLTIRLKIFLSRRLLQRVALVTRIIAFTLLREIFTS
jgi:hypothetical protein